MIGKLFLVVVTERPTKEEQETGKVSRLLLNGPQWVVARDKAHAQTLVLRKSAIPDLVADERLEVEAFPFG